MIEIKKPRIECIETPTDSSYGKYVVLALFVIAVPLLKYAPGFCKYVCPAGTFEAGFPLVVRNKVLQSLLGRLFTFKVLILVLVLIVCVFCFRAFCRFVCPLGAIYSFFHPVSVFGVKVDTDRCTHCNACVNRCPMDIRKVGDRECVHCGDCIDVCPEHCIRYGTDLSPKKHPAVTAVRVLLLCLVICLLALGISGGGVKALWQKAVRICYECIGIG